MKTLTVSFALLLAAALGGCGKHNADTSASSGNGGSSASSTASTAPAAPTAGAVPPSPATTTAAAPGSDSTASTTASSGGTPSDNSASAGSGGNSTVASAGSTGSGSADAGSTATMGAGGDTAAGQAVFAKTCAMCHTAGVAGAPKLGDKTDWGPRIAQGRNVLYQHAIAGFTGKKGMMPPKGGNTTLSDAQVKSAVDYMVAQAH